MKVGDKVKIIGSHTIEGKHRIGLIGEILDIDWRDEACFVLYPKGQAWVKRTDLEVIESINSPHPEATICGWVAVDDFDNAYIYHSKPTQRCREFCDTGNFITDLGCDTKYPNGKRCYVIDKDFFPDLTSESEPIPVEIIIKPKKQC